MRRKEIKSMCCREKKNFVLYVSSMIFVFYLRFEQRHGLLVVRWYLRQYQNWTLKKWDGKVWSGLIWLRTGKGSGRL